ncbi:MAG: 2-hydroxyacyl-CoA dehydratase [Lachnospira sp.]
MSITDLSQIKEQLDYLEYSKNVVHRHSKAVGKLLDLFRDHFDNAIKQISEPGGKQVVLTDFFPQILMYVADCVPLSVADLARLGTSTDIQNAEKYFQIPPETCPMLKSKIGGLYMLRDKPVKKSVLGHYICEPHVGAMSLMDTYGYETYWIDGLKKFAGDDKDRYKLVVDKYRDEIRNLFYWINGKAYDEDRFRKVLKDDNRIHSKVDKIMEFQKKFPSYMKSLPSMMMISGRGGYYGQPEAFEEILDELIEEFENLKEGEYNEKLVKLTWAGVRGVDFSVYNALDVSGGVVVAWTIAGSDSRYYDEEKDPLESFIEYNMGNINNSSMEDAAKREEDLYKKSGSDGVLIYGTLGCTNFTINREISRRYLSEQGIPTLAIQGTPLIGESTGQLLTRIKAFIEMLS